LNLLYKYTTQPPIQWVPGALSMGVKLTTHLRMREAIPPLPQHVFMAWYLVRHRTTLSLRYPKLWFSQITCPNYTRNEELIYSLSSRYYLFFIITVFFFNYVQQGRVKSQKKNCII